MERDSDKAEQRYTFQDWLQHPAGEKPALELIDGELSRKAHALVPHAHGQGELAFQLKLGDRRDDEPGWLFYTELDVKLGDNVLVPDVAGYRSHRPPAQHGRVTRDVPDWVCEILSRGHYARDRKQKAPIYGRHGVGHMWILDPSNRTLEAYAWRDGAWVQTGVYDDLDREAVIAPFDFAIDVAALFPAPPTAVHEPPMGGLGARL